MMKPVFDRNGRLEPLRRLQFNQHAYSAFSSMCMRAFGPTDDEDNWRYPVTLVRVGADPERRTRAGWIMEVKAWNEASPQVWSDRTINVLFELQAITMVPGSNGERAIPTPLAELTWLDIQRKRRRAREAVIIAGEIMEAAYRETYEAPRHSSASFAA